MQQCGFCSMLSGLLRRAMCIGSRRGSSESYYRELGDQDTLKIEDKSSDISDDSEVIIQEVPRQKDSKDYSSELCMMPKKQLCTGRFMTMHKRRKKRLLTRSLCQETALLDDLHPGQVQRILDQSVLWKFNAFTLENVSGGLLCMKCVEFISQKRFSKEFYRRAYYGYFHSILIQGVDLWGTAARRDSAFKMQKRALRMGRCLPVLCVHLFHIYGLISYFKLDAAKAWKLFSLIEEGYHSTNPYHNSVHAADVTQAMHCFLQQKQIRDHLEPLEVMASLLAAIAHDMDHPGVNQPFLIATSNHLAALYRNTSVLENHHWRSAISCLNESGLLDQMLEFRATLEHQISSLILATDITRQQEYLSQFKNYLDTNTLDMSKKEHRHLVLQIALKCADISNPCRPWEISRKWSLKVCEEFFRQGDYERKLNLPVTALCDRHTTSIPKIQTGFFKFVVTPLITEWHRFLQNDLSDQMLSNLLFNRNKWDTLVAQEMAEETRTEISDAELADDELDACSGTHVSDSSELLLPPRRSSLNPVKSVGLKDQLRRFSVPLNVFQDSKYKNKGRTSSNADPRLRSNGGSISSEHSLHSQLSVRGHCEHGNTAERILSTEKLLPDSSIASITTPVQASRLNTVLKDGGSCKLTRQQTFPPLETAARALALAVRPLHTSNEDAIYPSRRAKTDTSQKFDTSKKEGRFSNIFKRYDTDKTDNEDASENNNLEINNSSRNIEKENLDPSIRGAGGRPGSQLRDNLAAVPLARAQDLLARRRKSMPPDIVAYNTPKEKKMREGAIPEFLRRTLSGKECWPRRRGSAPAPAPPAEPRARRKPGGPLARCDRPPLPRRSSLPVEVFRPTELSES